MFERSEMRVMRYRRLAVSEADAQRASVLQRIADEAERGVLCMAPHPLAIRVVAERQRTLMSYVDWTNRRQL